MIIGSKTIRLGIFISTLIIAVIIILQLIWLEKLYRYEEKEFDHNIARVVRGLNVDLQFEDNDRVNLNNFISKIDESNFRISIRKKVNADTLKYYLQHELEDQEIFTDCYAGIYDASYGSYTEQLYLPSATSGKNPGITLPVMDRSGNHILLYFPHRLKFLLSKMEFWITASLLLLLVLMLFGGSLYYFYKQKFQNEIQREFVHNFTHEFKTPVSVITLAAESLRKPSTLAQPERFERYLSIVENQSKYLQSQIERLLQHANAESGHLQMQMEEINMHDLIREAVDNLSPLIEEKKAQIYFELEASRPTVKADREHLRIVIINLVENAIKYSSKPEVHITTAETLSHLRIIVKDNGQGIPEKDIDKIFRKFYRVVQDNVFPSKGFGIGLSFVKQIIAAHHGNLSVESVEALGSKFIVEIPY
jgi:two-component system, OmpR family, phosphate regulon sensor histidine kinase PhoR